MEFRRVLLRIMLVSLAMAAVLGAAAMLLFKEDVIWRVVGTTIATAVASGVMMAFSLLGEREHARNAGALGVVLSGVEFLLTLAMIWLPAGPNTLFEELLETAGSVALTGLPAVAALRLIENRGTRTAGLAGAVLSSCVLILLLMAIWHGVGAHESEMTQTAFSLGALGVLAVFSLMGRGQTPGIIRIAGVAAAGAAWLLALIGIWRGISGGGALTTAVSAAVLLALANLLLLCPLKPGQHWLRGGTLLCAALAAFLVDWMAFEDFRHDWDPLSRMAGAASIMAACGCLAMVVLYRLNRKSAPATTAAEITHCTLLCPRCQTRQVLPVGDTCCCKCRLRIQVRFEEPRCSECGYLLYLLTSDRCPECGTPVARVSAADVQVAAPLGGEAAGNE